MKIIVVEPYDLNKRYDVRSLNPNLGPVVIAVLLKQAGHRVEVVSEYVTRLDINELNDAELVCISIATYNARRGFEIARQVRRPVVFGGFHASLMPEECLVFGDYVIRGDGHPIVQLAGYLEKNKTGDIGLIPNLVYKKSGSVVYNRLESKAIDTFTDHALVRDYYRPGVKRLLRIPRLVNASRGCDHVCSFCSIKEVHQDFINRQKDIVIEEIRALVNDRPRLSRFLPAVIWITDDNFFSDKEWAKSILKELATLKSNFSFVLQARVEVAADDDILDLLRKANVGRLYLGIESISQRSLNHFRKDTNLEDARRAVCKIKKFGIDVYGLFVFGDDEFKLGDGKKVAKFVKQQGMVGVLAQPLTPFPGTRLFRSLKKQGRILHENWQDYNGKVVFKPKNLTAAELQKEIYDCYRSVYSPLRLAKYILFGKRGSKLGVIGEGLIRYWEWFKCKNYIKDKLAD